MARKRRTRKQKLQAKHDFTFKLGKESVKVHMPVSKKIPAATAGNLFHYDPQLIRADLTKTVLLSILAIGAIVSLFLMDKV